MLPTCVSVASKVKVFTLFFLKSGVGGGLTASLDLGNFVFGAYNYIFRLEFRSFIMELKEN